jgi:hypothetical protein
MTARSHSFGCTAPAANEPTFSAEELREETLAICQTGTDRSRSGRQVDISREVIQCVSSSVLYRPDYEFSLPCPPFPKPCAMEVSLFSLDPNRSLYQNEVNNTLKA